MAHIEMTTTGSRFVNSNKKLYANGFNSHNILPGGTVVDITGKVLQLIDGRLDPVMVELSRINSEADAISEEVLNLSTNVTSEYLKKSELLTEEYGTILSGIVETAGTFVTNTAAGQYYGLNLVTDAGGKKYTTGFSAGALVDPSTGISDSYFRVNADRFIIGGDLGDGFTSGITGELGEELPAFSIVQEDGQAPQMYFNGKVNINSIPESISKYIGSFTSVAELTTYLNNNPDVIVNNGDTYLNSTENVVYMWDGAKWLGTSKATKASIIFKRSFDKPSTPTGGDYANPPLGWSDGIPSYVGGEASTIWWSIATVDNITDYNVESIPWSEPQIASDTDTTDYMFHDTTSIPPSPTYSGPLTSVSTSDSANGWYNGATSNSVWAAYRSKSGETWSTWSVWKVKGEDGEAGVAGADGARGSTIARIYSTSRAISYYASNPSLLTNAVHAIVSPKSLQKGDQVIVTASDGTEIFEYNNGWTLNTALKVNGNAVIDGTLTVNKLTSGSSQIGSGYFSLGSGSSVNYGGASFSGTVMVNSDAGSNGIGGVSLNGFGIGGGSYFGTGVIGASHFATGIEGKSTLGYAGLFSGPVGITGTLSVSGSSITGNTITGSYISSSGDANVATTLNAAKVVSNSFWVGGTQVAFTAGHIVLSDYDIAIGDIICTDSVINADVSQTFPIVCVSNSINNKSVIGVIATVEDTTEAMSLMCKVKVDTSSLDNKDIVVSTAEVFKNSTYEQVFTTVTASNYKCYKSNSLGEGMINVCAANGNIDNGDYICSSNVAGKGMKQNDDILHNYTVAKALESVVWDNEVVGENGCFEQDGIKCKMIACTYHCG